MKIGLVAHDKRKHALMQWVEFNAETLFQHDLVCTGTTGYLITELFVKLKMEEGMSCMDAYDLAHSKITRLNSGPLGGDQQMGALIATNQLDALIFLVDCLSMQAHDSDIHALSRLAQLNNIAFACNRTSADMIISSPLFGNPEYQRIKPNFDEYLNRRI